MRFALAHERVDLRVGERPAALEHLELRREGFPADVEEEVLSVRCAAAVDRSAGLRHELPVHRVRLPGDLDHGLLVLDEGDLGREGRGAREHLVLKRHQAALDVPQLF